MSLEIIGAGYGRTGTYSTYHALNRLGLRCYHMFEVVDNPDNKGHLDYWRKVGNAAPGHQHDWEQVFEGYRATVDNPGCCVWRELAEAYPEAKVLLTLHPRGPDAWYDSTIDTIYFSENLWQFKLLALFTPFARKFSDMARKLIWQRSHAGTMSNRRDAIAHYLRHIEEVKAAVPAEKLLIFSVDQGWEPLCGFLGMPVPDEPFPNVNDRDEIKKSIADMTKGAYGILAAGGLVLAGLLYAAVWLAG